jgi:hypothetical protein
MIPNKYISFTFLLVNLLSLTPATIADDDSAVCDILCQAGIVIAEIEPPLDESESNNLSTSSMLMFSDTQSTKQMLQSSILMLEEAFGYDFPFSMDINSSYGTASSFSIDGFKLAFKDGPPRSVTPVELLNIGNSSCSGKNVNTYDVLYDVYSDLKIKNDWYKAYPNFSCNINNLSFNVEGFFELNGGPLEDEIGYGPAGLVFQLLNNIDIISSGTSSFDTSSNELVSNLEYLINFNDQLQLSISGSEGINPDVYFNFIQELRSIFIEEDIYETREMIKNNPSEFWVSFFEELVEDPEFLLDIAETSGLMEASQNLYGISFGISWSNSFYKDISILSAGTIDAGMMLAKAYTANKMNKYEVQMLLQNFGFDRELQGLYLDLVYSYYDQFFDETKIFVNNPQGIMFELKFAEGFDLSIVEELEENPMLFFTILNNMELSIKANPDF